MAEGARLLGSAPPVTGEPDAPASRRHGAWRTLKHAQTLLERSLGVKISRASTAGASRHADAALRNLRRWSASDVMFDVGANDGRTILRIRDTLSRPRIFAFEPVAATFQTLVARTSHLAGVTPLNLALGCRPERREIYVSDIASMSSLSADWTTAARVETIEVSTVDAVMAEQHVDFIHFLKVDTEGFELEVLRGAEGALRASRIAIVQLEVGFEQMRGRHYTPLEEARRYLAPMGYALYGIYNQCRTKARLPESWPAAEFQPFDARVLVYCDALFIRADLIQ